MGLDIRLPIGLLFTAIGAILTVYGAVSDTAMYERSLGLNVNLVWGALLLVFGLFMLYLGRRGSSGMHPSSTSPEGRAIEEMEKRTGKESD